MGSRLATTALTAILCLVFLSFVRRIEAKPIDSKEGDGAEADLKGLEKEVCRMGICQKWDMVVIILLKPGFRQFKFVRDIIRGALEDCKWFDGDIHIDYFTKNFTIVEASDYTMRLQLPSQVREGSQYEKEERLNIFVDSVSAAVDYLNPSTPERGSYILVITDFQQNAKDDKISEKEIESRIQQKAIQLRIVQLTSDGDEKTSFVTDILFNSHRVSSMNEFVGRVQVFEAKSVMDNFKPCPPLTQHELLIQTRTENEIRTQMWIERNIGATLIGAFLLVVAFLSVLIAYNYHKIRKTRVRKTTTQISIMDMWIK
ncbi:hypothetical protein L596_015684 [Steinernema carpocapsae]|uniref:VWFA domain-containing protein n=1 Tax=Steinernema carpocapsae TaxID=34508 RepID=A0A4U5NGS5_STECR|nr:hypothetical protein L596_015684 [Steinernema carpocapsae]